MCVRVMCVCDVCACDVCVMCVCDVMCGGGSIYFQFSQVLVCDVSLTVKGSIKCKKGECTV